MPQSSRPRLQVEQSGGATIARLRDRSLFGPTAEIVGEELLRLADRPRLRLDFAQVEELSGAMLGKLVGLHLKVRAAGGKLTLENLTPFVYELFEITRLTGVLHVRPRFATGFGSRPSHAAAPHVLAFADRPLAHTAAPSS
jgi:anti-anti-sigma factor